MAKTFAKLLDEHIKSKNISNAQLAEEIKKKTSEKTCNRHTIGLWCKGEVKRPNCEYVKAGADVLGLTLFQRVEFLAAAGCPYNEELAELLELSKNVRNDPPDIIEDNSQNKPIIGVPINLPHQFFGREKELKRIFGRWKQPPLVNVAVIGARRSGKTSLLHYIKNIHRAIPLREGQLQNWLLPTHTLYSSIFKRQG